MTGAAGKARRAGRDRRTMDDKWCWIIKTGERDNGAPKTEEVQEGLGRRVGGGYGPETTLW